MSLERDSNWLAFLQRDQKEGCWEHGLNEKLIRWWWWWVGGMPLYQPNFFYFLLLFLQGHTWPVNQIIQNSVKPTSQSHFRSSNNKLVSKIPLAGYQYLYFLLLLLLLEFELKLPTSTREWNIWNSEVVAIFDLRSWRIYDCLLKLVLDITSII